MNLTQLHMFATAVPIVQITPPRHNGRSQATIRREIRRRSNLPRAMQRRLGFKCK